MQLHTLNKDLTIVTYSDGTAALCSAYGVVLERYLKSEHITLPDFTTYDPDSIDMPSDLELSALYGV